MPKDADGEVDRCLARFDVAFSFRICRLDLLSAA